MEGGGPATTIVMMEWMVLLNGRRLTKVILWVKMLVSHRSLLCM